MASTVLTVQAPASGGYLPVEDPGAFTLILPYVGGALLVALWVCSGWFLIRYVTGDRRMAGQSVRALSVVVGSATFGGTYFAYLRAEPFAPDVVRVVPLLWLAGSVTGWILVARALLLDTRRLAAVVGLILNVPNTFFAAISSLAALMAD